MLQNTEKVKRGSRK